MVEDLASRFSIDVFQYCSKEKYNKYWKRYNKICRTFETITKAVSVVMLDNVFDNDQ